VWKEVYIDIAVDIIRTGGFLAGNIKRSKYSQQLSSKSTILSLSLHASLIGTSCSTTNNLMFPSSIFHGLKVQEMIHQHPVHDDYWGTFCSL
jgi:hypothetical protein